MKWKEMDSLTSAIVLYSMYGCWHFCALFQCVWILAWSVSYSMIIVHLRQSIPINFATQPEIKQCDFKTGRADSRYY